MMKKFLLAATLVFGLASSAMAQVACPAFSQGAVLTAGQWQACFDAKQNALGYTPLNQAGGTMTGFLGTVASATGSAGFNLPPGVAPTSPNDGDLWTTTSGVFARVNGSTVQLSPTLTPTFTSITVDGTGTGVSLQNNSGAILAVRDTGNTVDAALTAAAVTASGAVKSAGNFSVGYTSPGSGSIFFGDGGTSINAPSDGIIELLNGAGTDFTRLQFGGTTGSFPALVRSGTSILVKTADGTSDAGIQAGAGLFNGQITANAGINLLNTTGFTITSNGIIKGVVNDGTGVFLFTNIVSSGFNRLVFGTNDTSGNSIVKSGTAFKFRNGGDTSDVNISANNGIFTGVAVALNATAPSSGGTQAIQISSTANMGIWIGVGAPTSAAAQGSIYIRTDGTINARLYINTNGSTGWTAFNTAS